MRWLFAATIFAASVYGHHINVPGSGRKSLQFMPPHPHAIFRPGPHEIPINGFPPMNDADPLTVAKLFLDDILKDQLSQWSSYSIRNDSYTDTNTGVTHVYVRQVVNGLEVADGDFSINIKDGMVLSYSNSFYNGPRPTPFVNPDPDATPQEGEQFVIGDTKIGTQITVEENIAPRVHLHLCNNFFQTLPYDMASSHQVDPNILDWRPALLQFMAVATPKDSVLADILDNYDAYLDRLKESEIGHFVLSSDPTPFYVDNIPDTVGPVRVNIAYAQVPSKIGNSTDLILVWKFEVKMQNNWYEAAVSANSPHRIISVVDWASDSPIPLPPSSRKSATYNVFPWGTNDPSEGNRSIAKENFDILASPVGWHSLPYANDPSSCDMGLSTADFFRNTTTTWGNNVFAQESWGSSPPRYIDHYRPDAGTNMTFDYKYNPKRTNETDALAEAKKYINATIAQLFYTSNMVHDLYYRYGFDEVAGNFQQYNFGRGGVENDAVIANAQDSGFNNAFFMTPPDGQNGWMSIYLWNTANPYRDGDLDAGIVIHELSHGLSTRLTGGPANSGCLGGDESGGMGEGWGDFLATTIRSTRNSSDYPIAAWAANRKNGIRNFVYSLNKTVNPSTYTSLDEPGYAHDPHLIGEVWAEMLWVVSQHLIAKHGYSDDLFPPAPLQNGTIPEGDFYRPKIGKQPLVPKHGNTLMIQLLLNGMKLQKCNPSFFDARNAIIQADQVLTGGENYCTLWKGFAERGLGPSARFIDRKPWGKGTRTDDYELPPDCEKMREEPNHVQSVVQ